MKAKVGVLRLRNKFLFLCDTRYNYLVPSMSAIDNNEIGATTVEVDLNEIPLANAIKPRKKEPKRVLHFSDGTMEEYDSDTSEDEPATDGVEEPFRKAKERALEAEPPIDPKTLSWPAWMKHYTVAGGSKTLDVMDRMGENIAYFLGITTPKYQYEIDEFHRAREEQIAAKKREDMEGQSWVQKPNQASSSTTEVITEEQKLPVPSDDKIPV
ncbi:unnamed protein product [Allacma fusca]|uniref:Protein FAM177A1 n=1 Tax=Allacma fusca TaxID=39272 RepID=A0A8J2KL74_9HEXA|nr:unnamed protein product [Allacma fusca]